MRSSNMNSRVPEPVLASETHCNLQIESLLRIRPLLRKEREDAVMLEPLDSTGNGPETVVLNPLHPSLMSPVNGSSLRNRADSDSTSINVPVEYHFNHVLPETTSQDKLYYTLGHPIASDTMKSLKLLASSRNYGFKKTKTHLLVCMGVANSGKTFTCFGGTAIPKRRAAQDGLVPRLLDSLFSQSKHNTGGSSKGFAVQISMIQVTQPNSSKSSIDTSACQVHDLFAFSKTKLADTPSKHKATVRNMAAKFERAISSPQARSKSPKSKGDDHNIELNPEHPKPILESVRDATQAREVLQKGLSASEKLSKGNQNFHLLVTLQPILDGTKFGDKIVILDMAGLEKEKRSGGNGISRKSDNVSSLNQTATAAVLRCLRVMTHNTNICNGKGNAVDYTGCDDDVSEISFVSQAKDPIQRQLKPVPFRQHKVTMLLNPLFTKSSTVNVHIILTAYPGHVDLQQKRILLQDVELLHGSSLVPPLSAIVETGLNGEESGTMSEKRDNDDKASTASGVENKNKSHEFNIVATKRIKSDLPGSNAIRRVLESSQPDAPKISRHYSGVTSKAVRVEKVQNRVVNKGQLQRNVQPSAPIFPGDMTPREELSDFPGVKIPTIIDKKSNRSNNRRSVEYASSPSPIKVKGHTSEDIPGAKPKDRNVQDGGKLSNSKLQASSRLPLERSSLENSMSKPQTKEYTKQDQYALEEQPMLKNHTSTTQVHNDSQSSIKRLEKKLQECIQEKHALERVCAQLEKENAELRNEAREAGRKVLQSQWTDQDEEEFMASRRMRREAQNLIKAPIQEHLEKVNYIYGIKNQWCMTNKQHFSLQFPNQFQRAPALDMRDKAKKEADPENNSEVDNTDQQAIRQTRSEDLGCMKGRRLSFGIAKPRMSLVPLHQKPVPEPPSGLSALKRLAARRASNH